MKKRNFIALILGTVSGTMFSLGMCMALISDWNAFRPGVVLGGTGLVLSIITLLLWRRMAGKAPLRLSGKGILTALAVIAGALTLGIGLCFCMVWGQLVPGVLLGLAGIVMLLCLIPLTRGLTD